MCVCECLCVSMCVCVCACLSAISLRKQPVDSMRFYGLDDNGHIQNPLNFGEDLDHILDLGGEAFSLRDLHNAC